MSGRASDQAALTPKLGGLGLRRAVEHAGFAYSASWHESKKQAGENWARPDSVAQAYLSQKEASFKFDDQMHKFLVDSAPSEREKQRLLCVAQPHAGAFVTAVPSNEDGNDTILRPRVYRTAILYRLGLPVLNGETPCPLCVQTINIYGDHATCCANNGDLIIRHNAIRNLVNSIATDGILSPVMEKKGILGVTSGRRPGDVSIPDWSGSGPLAIDVAVTSPLTKSAVRLPSPCEDYALTKKHAKYDASFEGSNYSFCAMVFETFGALNSEGEEVLRQMFRFAAKHLGKEFTSYCSRAWARVSCALQKSVAQTILNRIDGNRESLVVESEAEPSVEPSVGVAPEVALGIPPSPSETKQVGGIEEKGESKKEAGRAAGGGVAVAGSSGSSRSTFPRINITKGWEGHGDVKEDVDKHDEYISSPLVVVVAGGSRSGASSTSSEIPKQSISVSSNRSSSSSSSQHTISSHTITSDTTPGFLRHVRRPTPLQ